MNEQQPNEKIKTEIVDEFYEFQTRIRRLIKDMVKNPTMRVVLSARRNLSKSIYRQIEYVIEIADDKNVHFFDLDDLIKGGFAVPVAPDYPGVEAERDPTAMGNVLEATDLIPIISKEK